MSDKDVSRDPLRPERCEERLREVLAPRPEAVERIVRNALASEEVAPRWRPAFSFAAALLAGMALLFAWQLQRVRFAPEPKTRPAAISIVNEGGVLIATSPSGSWLVRSAEPEPETPGIIIVSYGGTEP
jgi:hypothetical protein